MGEGRGPAQKVGGNSRVWIGTRAVGIFGSGQGVISGVQPSVEWLRLTTLSPRPVPPACSRGLSRAAGASCLAWGLWAALALGWDCCWAPPRALDSCVPFTARGGNGPSALARARNRPTLWTTRRLQSLDSRVGTGPEPIITPN